MSLYDELLSLVPEHLHHESGEVFLSGRTAFEQPSPLYVLGYNPGGRPDELGDWTIARDIKSLREDRHDWTGLDDEWSVYGAGRTHYAPGQSSFQRRVKHLYAQCGLDPKRVPFNNCLFVRSARVHTLAADRTETLLRDCWPVHERAIAALDARVLVCLGKHAGWWLRTQVEAHRLVETFIEDNRRRWKSTTHEAGDGPYAGLQVVTLTHPSTADWINPATDPTGLVVRALAYSRG